MTMGSTQPGTATPSPSTTNHELFSGGNGAKLETFSARGPIGGGTGQGGVGDGHDCVGGNSGGNGGGRNGQGGVTGGTDGCKGTPGGSRGGIGKVGGSNGSGNGASGM
jgi:hypothetical protein